MVDVFTGKLLDELLLLEALDADGAGFRTLFHYQSLKFGWANRCDGCVHEGGEQRDFRHILAA